MCKHTLILMCVFLSPFISINANANEDCSYDLASAKSPLDVKASSVKQSSAVKLSKKENTITQSLSLKDGATITYKEGGCEHLTRTYVFELGSIPANPTANEALSLAVKLVASVPITQEEKDSGPSELFSKALLLAKKKKAKLTNKKINLPCDGADCTLSLTKEHQLALSWSFQM